MEAIIEQYDINNEDSHAEGLSMEMYYYCSEQVYYSVLNYHDLVSPESTDENREIVQYLQNGYSKQFAGMDNDAILKNLLDNFGHITENESELKYLIDLTFESIDNKTLKLDL